MKTKNTLILVCSLFIAVHIVAQERIIVRQVTHQMSKGEQPGYEVNIPEANLASVKKEWMRYLEKNTKGDAVQKGHEIVLEHIVKEDISPDTTTIYSMILLGDDQLELHAFYEINDKFFRLSDDPATIKSQKIHRSIEAHLYDFAVDQYRNAVSEELDLEENHLKELESELKDIQKNIESLRKDIAGSVEQIKKHETEISLLEVEKEQYMEQLEGKRIESTAIKDKEEMKVHDKIVKGIEKSKRKVEKSIEKEKKKIISEEADISGYETSLKRNEKLEEEKLEEIREQREVISRVEEKLGNIR